MNTQRRGGKENLVENICPLSLDLHPYVDPVMFRTSVRGDNWVPGQQLRRHRRRPQPRRRVRSPRRRQVRRPPCTYLSEVLGILNELHQISLGVFEVCIYANNSTLKRITSTSENIIDIRILQTKLLLEKLQNLVKKYLFCGFPKEVCYSWTFFYNFWLFILSSHQVYCRSNWIKENTYWRILTLNFADFLFHS